MTHYRSALEEIARRIGPGVSDLSFVLVLEGGTLVLGVERFDLHVETRTDKAIVFSGRWRDVRVRWAFTLAQGGYWVTLDVASEHGLDCAAITSLGLTYRSADEDATAWRVPTCGLDIGRVGMLKVESVDESAPDSLMRGVFKDSRTSGLFVGTHLPQSFLHLYRVREAERNGVTLTCTTQFTDGAGKGTQLESEATWVCASKPIADAIEAYASHVPLAPARPAPPVGWNSWDYYAQAVSMDDLVENMEEIRKDPVFARQIRYIVLDDGWAHACGEWYTNYRFPGGLKRIASEISNRGFVPGIWTAPAIAHSASVAALRSPEFLVKDAYGDPKDAGLWMAGHYIVDPTHPSGEAFIRDLYTRLFEAGFRAFKVDFVSFLAGVERFHDPTKGPYDVIRGLFGLIRECVTDASHIIGCSLPEECGPGCADSGRTGIDIHNHWSHIEWAVDYSQTRYWLHNRVWVNDLDFLVVRGKDTSLEEETNVLNPAARNPDPPRWRSGPVFTREEAQTWANLVALSGGSVFLSDRVRTLNEEGRGLIRKVLKVAPTGVAACPLDLCDDVRASLWLQTLADEYRLGIINWSDEAQDRVFSFQEYGLAIPAEAIDVWSGDIQQIQGGQLTLSLVPHASALIRWSKRV